MIPNKWDIAHMKVAETYASLSSAERMKVGAILVKQNRIISIGYNGMPSGWDNTCEEPAHNVVGVRKDGNDIVEIYLKTKPEVLHAEANAITKVARSNESSEGSTLYTTVSPCMECAKMIYQSGVKKVWFKDEYRDKSGIDFLIKCNVEVFKYVDPNETNVTL